jgi:hypothetical protein
VRDGGSRRCTIFDFLGLLWDALVGVWHVLHGRGPEGERERRPTPHEVVGAIAILLTVATGILGFVAYPLWAVTGLLGVGVLPIVGVLGHRYKVAHGIYTSRELKVAKESVVAWSILLVLVAVFLLVFVLL